MLPMLGHPRSSSLWVPQFCNRLVSSRTGAHGVAHSGHRTVQFLRALRDQHAQHIVTRNRAVQHKKPGCNTVCSVVLYDAVGCATGGIRLGAVISAYLPVTLLSRAIDHRPIESIDRYQKRCAASSSPPPPHSKRRYSRVDDTRRDLALTS